MAALRGGLHPELRVWRSGVPMTCSCILASRSRALRVLWPQAKSSYPCSRVKQQSASLAAVFPFQSFSASARETRRSFTFLSSCPNAAPAGHGVIGEGPRVASLPLGKLCSLRLPFCFYSIAHSPGAPLKVQASFPARSASPDTPEVEGKRDPEGAPPPVKSGGAEGGPPTAVRVEFDVSGLPGTENARDGLMALIFTCCKCNTRAAKKFSKQQQQELVNSPASPAAAAAAAAVAACAVGWCFHLVADRLKWFGDEASDVESILAAKGEAVLRSLAEAHYLDVEGMDSAVLSQGHPVS
ncbi:hypothetical protein Emag_002668 [Eimeria magna]